MEEEKTDEIDARAVRASMGMSRSKMADFLGVSYHTYRSWEEKNPDMRKKPSGAARSLLRICAARPDVVRAVLNPGLKRGARKARRQQSNT
ncbi:hypothetical protein RHDC4_00743 [Rhodocyclaceae bacterium]|nr:hypothetical protein RHDC4_00743 [Rhodocyclaceae bacterium]